MQNKVLFIFVWKWFYWNRMFTFMDKKTTKMNAYYKLILVLLILVAACKQKDSGEIKVEELLHTSESWNGDLLPKYLDGVPEIKMLKYTIPGNTKLKMHKHLVINAGLMLKGKLTVVSQEGDTLHLKSGDPIMELVNKWHYGINEYKEPVEIVVFYAGVKGVPVTIIKEGDNTELH